MTVAPERSAGTARIVWWLYGVAGLVVVMILVGGATRLTDSGLSITEWKPVTGALPPMSVEAWEAEFAKYREIPEYQRVNRGMSLDEFKTIYWWEWGHRLLGRLIGAAFLLPLLWFLARGAIPKGLAPRLWALFALGGLQGAIGWWMVASGLTERVDVSQHRLAVHLGLAFVILGLLLWTAWEVAEPEREAGRLRRWGLGLVALIWLQILLGALVAGLHAGLIYNEWPLMDGRLVPLDLFAHAPQWAAMFENVALVQFNHRLGAYGVVAAALALGWAAGRPGLAVACLALVQALLGIWTLIAVAPISLALAHQAGAVALFVAGLRLAFTGAALTGEPLGSNR